MNESDIVRLRNEIDKVNERIMIAIAERFKLTDEIGRIKKEEDLPIVDRDREAAQLEKVDQLTRNYDLDRGMVRLIMRAIIDEVYIRHDLIRKK